jgi:pregnancy-associated plasma protein-A
MRVFTPHRRTAVVLGIATAVLTGFGVSPASAKAPATVSTAKLLSYCNPLAPARSELFSALSAFQPAVLGRGGDAREPDTGQIAEDLPASAVGKAGKSFKATVPVWFHVISDGSIGNVTSQQIADQMQVLNLAFAGFYGGATSGFSFKLAGVDRTDNASWFYARINSNEERAMKQALHRGGAEMLNVYSSTADAYLGWAYLPDIVTKPGQTYKDGIVFDWESMVHTSTRYAAQYDLGQTLTHEAGHWFNLEHTFYGACNAKGDFVADTPPEGTPTRGCPIGKDTCPDPGLDPIHNYMDYSYDSCYEEFTAGQVQRMRDSWLLYRAS